MSFPGFYSIESNFEKEINTISFYLPFPKLQQFLDGGLVYLAPVLRFIKHWTFKNRICNHILYSKWLLIRHFEMYQIADPLYRLPFEMLKFERYWGKWIINTYLEYPSFPSRPTWCTRSPASSRCGQQCDPSCVRGGQTIGWLIDDWLIDWLYIVFVSFENISLKYRRQHRQWRDAKFKPSRLGAYGFWALRDSYRAIVATCMTRFLRLDSLIPKDHPVLQSFTTSQGLWEPILNRIPKVY